MIYYIEMDGVTVTEWGSAREWERFKGKEPLAATRLFAVDPIENKNLSQDPGTGRWVYTSPDDGRMAVLYIPPSERYP